jgi:ABC-2 type transport system permease protein
MIFLMLSGGFSPLESMPEPLQVAIQVSPEVHYVKFAQSVLYRAAGIDVVWRDIAVLAGLGTVFLSFALLRFRTMFASVR